MFLLDVKQANAVWKNLKGYYVAYNNDGMAWPYWLRTPVTDCNHDMRYVSSSGEVGRYAPWYSDLGVRPAFYLDTEYFVATSGSGTQGNPYVGSAPNKQEADYTISEPAEEANPDWNVSTEQSIQPRSDHGIRLTGNTLILPFPYTLFRRLAATRKIWLSSFAVRDIQKVSRANLSMM